jgi:NADH-quinone oxidoreductase subunit I
MMSRTFNENKKAKKNSFPSIPIGVFLSLRIAFKNLFRPAITIQYPHQRAHIPNRARWAVEINYAEDKTHRCTACRVCEKECPDYLIELDIETAQDRSRFIKSWRYRRGGCMMCGLCVEVCPFDAIKMGHDYELAHADPELLEMDLLTNVAAYKRPRAARPAKPAADKPAAKKAQADAAGTTEAKAAEDVQTSKATAAADKSSKESDDA